MYTGSRGVRYAPGMLQERLMIGYRGLEEPPVTMTIECLELFSKNRPLADSFIESIFIEYISVCLSPFHVTFFEASHWPSGLLLLFYIIKTPKNSRIYIVSSVSQCFHLCLGLMVAQMTGLVRTLINIISAFPCSNHCHYCK